MAKKNNVIPINRNSKNTLATFPLGFSSLIEKEFFEIAVKGLLNSILCKDEYTWGHSLRVAYYSVQVGLELGLSENELYELELSALFHDVGKIGVPESVLGKPSRLSEEEFQEMKLHPTKSHKVLADLPKFELIAKNVLHHHERFDGRGYPGNLKGEDIPLYSRIILIADTFDAMTSSRPYRKGLDYQIAFEELKEFSGSQFDPNIVTLFIKAMTKESEKNVSSFSLKWLKGEFKKDAA